MTALLGPAEIRDLAARLGVTPTKRLGQNFVHDPNTVRRIVAAADLQPDDVVLEVGPGLGSLTLGLIGTARHVHAVEIDPVLAKQLPETARHADNLTVHTADALKITAIEDPQPTALVANLPYNVAVPVVLHLLATLPTLRSGLVMVQKEVADRLDRQARQQDVRHSEREAGLVRRRAPGGSGPAQCVLAGAQRRLRPRRVHPARAAAHRRTPGGRSSRSSTPRSPSGARRCAPPWPAGPGGADAAARVLVAAEVDPQARGEQLTVAQFAAIAAAASPATARE